MSNPTAISSRLIPEDNNKLTDAAAFGRSKTTMPSTELTEYAGAAHFAYNDLEARVTVLAGGTNGHLDALLDTRILAPLADATPLGRSKSKINHADLTEYAGALYGAYVNLAARVGTFLVAPPLATMQNDLEAVDNARLTANSTKSRPRMQMTDKMLTDWAGATNAMYTALEALVTLHGG